MRPRYTVKVYRLHVSEAGSIQDHVDGPFSAKQIAHAFFQTLRDDREHFAVLALTAKNGLIGVSEISTGAVSGTVVDPKVLFRTLLVMGAARFLLAHNHPSSDTTPSPDDIVLTQRLRYGGRLLDLECLDHLIVGDGTDNVYSFQEAGLWADQEGGWR